MMREKRTERRFNLLDAIAILLLLLILVGVWQRQNLQKLFTTDEVLDEYTVSFAIKKMRSTTVDLLDKGTVLYTENDGERIALGALADSVASSAATVDLYDKNGKLVQAVYPQDPYEYLLDVAGTILCSGVERNGSFLVGGKMYLAYNKTVFVQTETADFEIVITDIQKVQ